MPISSPSSPSLIPPNQASAGSVKSAAAQIGKIGGDDASAWAATSAALTSIQRQLDQHQHALQQAIPIPNPLQITAPDGSLIAEIGNIVDPNANVSYSGIWGNNLFIGGGGPGNAPLYSNGKQVVLGHNGQVYILDPYANVGAWLGTQSEAPQNVTGSVNDGFAQVQLTVTAHGYRNGDWVNVASVGGVPNATGQWVISNVAANTFSLTGSTWAGTYTSGGTAQRYFSGGSFETIAIAAGKRITNAVNNGSGLVRLTITAHGYSTGYAVTTTNVNGVPGANGTFLVTVINANTFDLQGSVFSGAYVSGGISINWPTAKLLAQGDGSLLLNNATIISTSSGHQVLIDSGQIVVSSAGAPPETVITNGQVQIIADAVNNYELIATTAVIQIFADTSAFAKSPEVILSGCSGTTPYGPLVAFYQSRGTGSAQTVTKSGDTLGGLVAYGFDGVGESNYAAGIRVVATQDHTIGAQGSKLVFETCPNGSATAATAVAIDQNGVTSIYNGVATAGIGTTPVYASVSVTNKTANYSGNLQVGGAIAPAGQYRLSYYAATRTAGTGNVATTFGWNDGISAKTYGPAILTLIANAFIQTSGQCIVTAGASNITFSSVYTGTGAYDLYISLERLA